MAQIDQVGSVRALEPLSRQQRFEVFQSHRQLKVLGERDVGHLRKQFQTLLWLGSGAVSLLQTCTKDRSHLAKGKWHFIKAPGNLFGAYKIDSRSIISTLKFIIVKTTFFFIALFLGNMMILNAQELLLPVSTPSETAKAEYVKALRAAEDANIPVFFERLNAAVKTDPNFFMAHAYMALAQTSFGQYENAVPSIKSALAVDAEGLNKGERIIRQALQTLEKDPRADIAESMASLTEAYPETAQAYELAAVSASWISKDAQAAKEYNLRLLELRPGHGGTYNALGYTYMALGEMGEAKAAFEKYLEVSPDEPNAWDSMGEYYMVAKDYAKSAEYYDKAAEMGMELAKERAEKARAAITKN